MATKNPTASFDGQSTQVPEINNFLGAQWRVPYFARNWKYHRSYMGPAGNGLTYARHLIGMKFGFTDPVISHELPDPVEDLIRGLIHFYRKPKAGFLKRQWNKAANLGDDLLAQSFLGMSTLPGAKRQGGFADWFKLGLLEPPFNTVTIKSHDLQSRYFNDARNIRFVADVPYTIVLYVGRGDVQDVPAVPPQKNVIAQSLVDTDGHPSGLASTSAAGYDHEAVSNVRWCKVGIYVPDVEAQKRMQWVTYNYYMQITGRALGEDMYNPKEDVYWRLSGWERAFEALKIPGWTVKEIARRGVSGAVTLGIKAVTGTSMVINKPIGPDINRIHDKPIVHDGAGNSAANPLTYAKAVWNGRTEEFNRKSIVPPDYCFVKFNCLLYVKVVAVGS